MASSPTLPGGRRPGFAAARLALLVGALLAGAFVLIATILDADLGLGSVARAPIVGLICAAVIGLLLIDQLEVWRGARALRRAIAERADAISSMQAATDVLAASEARLRLLLDSAVDGIVELDAEHRIVRANEAFSRMVELPLDAILGKTWAEVAAAAPSGDALHGLASTGEAVLESERGTVHLEARSSVMPTTPPGTLMLIRDVTASRKAEQTIRTLFQFLQDRDEDRTQMLKRTNAAIEAERNRIARDLHDGPIQGISGASLSLAAVKMMVEMGDPRAAEMVQTIKGELEQEASNLRRLMVDLRPPVLDERGLIAAVDELCARFERETGLRVSMSSLPEAQLPPDLETLAYRIIQEALSNVAKHAEANEVSVRVEATGGQLQVEVADDGRGFDPAQSREFLRRGKVGLASMRERTELGGGTFSLKSEPGAGTTVTATFPFDPLALAPRLKAGDAAEAL